MNDELLEDFLAEKIAELTIQKLANLYKEAAPKVMSNASRAVKSVAAGPVGTPKNFQKAKVNLGSPTGKQTAQSTINSPMVSTPVLNDQIIGGTNLQAAGFAPQYPISNPVSSGDFQMMNNSL